MAAPGSAPILMTMSWLVRAIVQPEAVDDLTSQFWDAGTNGVAELPDPDRDPADKADTVLLIAGFETEDQAQAAAGLHQGATIEPLDPTNWEDPPITEISVSGQTITIDAQHAFGHGKHPTTQLVIDTLSALVGNGSSFLDIGTGTGVLAIAAKKLGADRVVAVDNDPVAIESAGQNAAANEVVIKVSDLPLVELAAQAVADNERFDLVVANMLLADLRPLAASIIDTVEETLVLSGFLEEQADEVVELFTPWRPISRLERDGWVCVVLQ